MYTQNNSTQMRTVVETYVIEEVQELIYDNEKLQQWNDHVAELGLEGQKQLVKPEKSPIPFLFMNKRLVEVFETLCPTKEDIKKFGATPIPVEILGLVALAQREQYFKKIEVWYDNESPDPAVIGFVRGEGKETYMDSYWNRYLIGRWADVKASFEELAVRAKARWIPQHIASLKDSISFYERQIASAEKDAVQRFGV
jgi:hypothetical protein